MNFNIVNINQVSRDVLNKFVDDCDEAWLWHRYESIEAFNFWHNRMDFSFVVVENSVQQDIVAVIPLKLIKLKTAKLIEYNMFESIGGPACTTNKYKKGDILEFIGEYLVELCNKYNVNETLLQLCPLAPGYRGTKTPRVNPLLSMGFENVPSQTWMIDLSIGKEQLWKNIESSKRNKIRKAEKSGVTVRAASTPEDLDIYYKLHCDTYERTGMSPHQKKYFELTWENFLIKHLSYIIFAEYSGEVIAAENFAVYKNSAVYWTSASNSKGLELQANSLLQWSAMQWMADHNMEWYETGEAFPHLSSGKLKQLNDFKKSFGGELYPIYISAYKRKTKYSLLADILHGIRGLIWK
jgi:hypothetical protein